MRITRSEWSLPAVGFYFSFITNFNFIWSTVDLRIFNFKHRNWNNENPQINGRSNKIEIINTNFNFWFVMPQAKQAKQMRSMRSPAKQRHEPLLSLRKLLAWLLAWLLACLSIADFSAMERPIGEIEVPLERSRLPAGAGVCNTRVAFSRNFEKYVENRHNFVNSQCRKTIKVSTDSSHQAEQVRISLKYA